MSQFFLKKCEGRKEFDIPSEGVDFRGVPRGRRQVEGGFGHVTLACSEIDATSWSRWPACTYVPGVGYGGWGVGCGGGGVGGGGWGGGGGGGGGGGVGGGGGGGGGGAGGTGHSPSHRPQRHPPRPMSMVQVYSQWSCQVPHVEPRVFCESLLQHCPTLSMSARRITVVRARGNHKVVRCAAVCVILHCPSSTGNVGNV